MMDLKQISLDKTISQLKEEGKSEEYITAYANEVANRIIFSDKIIITDKERYSEIRDKYIVFLGGREKDWDSASELLVRYIKKQKYIYTTKEDVKTEVWIYKEGIYLPNGKSEIKELLRKILGEYYTAYIYNLVLAKIEADTFIETKDFFLNKYIELIPAENGILNVLTQELTPYDPNKIFFNKIPVKFNILAKCPNIEKFLKEILAQEEDIKIYYEMAGFGLLKEYRYEKAVMMHGEGRNGKGKSIELLKRLVGIENCCSIPLSSLKPESFSISELFGKLFNLAGDIGSTDLKETNTFKSATGRDILAGHRKFLNDIFFTNHAKFIFACNELPMVYDMSRGFWDRWILLDFPYTFVTKDEYDTTKDKLMLKIREDNIIEQLSTPEELSGLLNEALAGLQRLVTNKKFSSTRGSEEVKSCWIRKSNSFMAFCYENIIDCYEERILKKDLRKRYTDFCRLHKLTPKSDFVIKKVLQENYGASEERLFDSILNVQNQYWEGIKFTS